MQMFINSLEECPRVQVRRTIDVDTVERYQEGMKSGAVFPPLVVFREPDTERYVVADGHQRLQAARDAELESIEVDVRDGDETDALEFALGCNAEHGLPRTRADIQNGVRLLMTNLALKKKYRTNNDRADLMKLARSTFQTHAAIWRESEGGNETEQKAKAMARASAKKKTRKTNELNPVWSSSDQNNTGSESGDGSASGTPRHSFKDADALNLQDFETSIELLALFPMSGAEAARKYPKDVADFDLERVRSAHKFLSEFLEAVE